MHTRKSLRFPEYDYSTPAEYFITICVKDNLHRLGMITNNESILSDEGIIVEKWIKNLILKFTDIVIEYFVIMPNHIHLIIEIREIKKKEESSFCTDPSPLKKEDNYEEWRIARKNMLLPKIINYLNQILQEKLIS